MIFLGFFLCTKLTDSDIKININDMKASIDEVPNLLLQILPKQIDTKNLSEISVIFNNCTFVGLDSTEIKNKATCQNNETNIGNTSKTNYTNGRIVEGMMHKNHKSKNCLSNEMRSYASSSSDSKMDLGIFNRRILSQKQSSSQNKKINTIKYPSCSKFSYPDKKNNGINKKKYVQQKKLKSYKQLKIDDLYKKNTLP